MVRRDGCGVALLQVLPLRPMKLCCRYRVEEAIFTVSAGSQVIFREPLRGKKTGGFLAVRSAYLGTMARTLAVPSGVNNLPVVVVSKDGSFDIEKQISANLSSSFSPTLFVAINGNTMDLQWKAARNPTN